MRTKIMYLEGLRGIAALVVVISHFFRVFYPGLFHNDRALYHGANEYLISSTPLNLVYNGFFAVAIFFVLSGFVLSYHFFKTGDKGPIIKSLWRRYPRLSVPAFFSVILAFLIIKLDLSFYQEVNPITKSFMEDPFDIPATFTHLLASLFIFDFFLFRDYFNPVLWTMTFEFLGSLMLFLFLLTIGKSKVRLVFYPFFVFVFFGSWFLSFVIGIFLADLLANGYWNGIKTKTMKTIVLISGLFIGSFPYINPEGTMYDFLFVNTELDLWAIYPVIGSSLVLLVLLSSQTAQKYLSSKPFVFLGRISFSLYLTHFMIILTFSSWFFLKIVHLTSYHLAFLTVFIVSIFPVFLLATLFTKYIDEPVVRVLKRIKKT